MKTFSVKPRICMFDKCDEFLAEYAIGRGDIVFTIDETREAFLNGKIDGATVINIINYGKGEPTDKMVEAILADLKGVDYSRVFAIGGGTILDVAKLFALETVSPVVDLFEKRIPAVKSKKLVLVPTTCGTGSEMTNISILELTAINSKFGLAVDELYADDAVLVPELLSGLPFRFFATSSIDALIHAVESYVSPKANAFTRMYSEESMRMILTGFKAIAQNGEDARQPLLPQFCLASTYAGIAFGNAGCGAVHAMSYPLGAAYHVPHGESNYAIFTGVFKTYQRLNPDGGIGELNKFLAGILGCEESAVYDEIETLLNHILQKKPLREYGVTEYDLATFTENVMTKQGRLMANNYTELSLETVLGIYKELY